MPCHLKNIPCDDSTLQDLFVRVETAISLTALVVAAWQLAQRVDIITI